MHIPAILEPSGILRNDGKRPDGATLMPWSKGKCLLWDATYSDTLAKTYISSTSHSAGAAALSAEKRKHKKYEDGSNTYMFVPFAIVFGPELLSSRFLTSFCAAITTVAELFSSLKSFSKCVSADVYIS